MSADQPVDLKPKLLASGLWAFISTPIVWTTLVLIPLILGSQMIYQFWTTKGVVFSVAVESADFALPPRLEEYGTDGIEIPEKELSDQRKYLTNYVSMTVINVGDAPAEEVELLLDG